MSVAVIVAAVGPLVEARPDQRLLIVVWSLADITVTGLVYALVREVQRKE